MGLSSFKSHIQDIVNTFQKQKPKTYILGFLYDSNEDKQRQLIYLTFQLYYKDETNPFAQLMSQLMRHSIKGVYPDAVLDEAKYLKIVSTQERLIKEAKGSGATSSELEEYINQERFNKVVDKEANSLVERLKKNQDKLYYVIISTDDTEYQSELDKMQKKENAVRIKDQMLNIVLYTF